MSTFNDIDIECPQCGEEFRGTVWVALHAGVDPELKDLMLGGELNLVGCPECGYVTFQEHFLIYQEPAAELIAYVYPESQRDHTAELQILMDKGFQEAQAILSEKQRIPYKPILFFGLESLVELLNEETAMAEQSHVAQALCKQNKLNVELLSPSHARRLGTMRVLPYAGHTKPPARADILAGIEQLLAIDPVLNLYTQLSQTIQANPNWTLGNGDR